MYIPCDLPTCRQAWLSSATAPSATYRISTSLDRAAIASSSHRFKAEARSKWSLVSCPGLHSQEMSELGFEPVCIVLTMLILHYRSGHRHDKDMGSPARVLMVSWTSPRAGECVTARCILFYFPFLHSTLYHAC